jgi:hypothetical protein
MPIPYLLNVGSLKRQQIHLAHRNEEVPHVLEVLDGGLRRPIGRLHRVNGVLHDLPKQQPALRSQIGLWTSMLFVRDVRTLGTVPGLTRLRTLQRMRPLRSAVPNSSSDGLSGSASTAAGAICRSHRAASHLRVAAYQQVRFREVAICNSPCNSCRETRSRYTESGNIGSVDELIAL